MKRRMRVRVIIMEEVEKEVVLACESVWLDMQVESIFHFLFLLFDSLLIDIFILVSFFLFFSFFFLFFIVLFLIYSFLYLIPPISLPFPQIGWVEDVTLCWEDPGPTIKVRFQNIIYIIITIIIIITLAKCPVYIKNKQIEYFY